MAKTIEMPIPWTAREPDAAGPDRSGLMIAAEVEAPGGKRGSPGLIDGEPIRGHCASPRGLRRFLEDRSATSAIEFVFALPLLLMVYLGTFEGTQALSAHQKVGTIANSIGNLVTRSTTMDDVEIANILALSGVAIIPFAADDLVMMVTAVKIDSKGKPTVQWSKSSKGTALAVGAPYPLPAELQTFKDTFLIFTKVDYTYRPLFSYAGILTNIELSESYSFRPRRSVEIPWV